MSHKNRNKPIGGKGGVFFDRPVPKFLQPYVQSPTERVDIETKRERQVDQVNAQEEIANLRKQGFHVESEPFCSQTTSSSLTTDQQSSDPGKESEKKKESSDSSVLLDSRKPTPLTSRGRNQAIAGLGIKKRNMTAPKSVFQKDNKKLSVRGGPKAVDRQLLSFQEQDD
ncbi:hypothetical protein GpartN1_g4418.t1 [Galdieria partita]|uniref:Uncharacterized protein n=1 Tax=Galdieria partita TaxID=83374 RepID=A0A9C7PZZ9_9RHOD|nr:hypothetical protein GpartN1_g4418.t1 [Galdieria partita]